MNDVAKFFAGSETTLGVFYPNHCLTAVFAKRATAIEIAAKLTGAGFADDDVLAASGKQVLDYDHEQHSGPGALMRVLSRFFRTEQAYTDHDLEHARHHAGFLVVRCPNEESKQSAWRMIEPGKPLDARYYSTGAIEHLAGDEVTD